MKNIILNIIRIIVQKFFLNKIVQRFFMLLSLSIFIIFIFVFFIEKEKDNKFLILQFKEMSNIVNIYMSTFQEIDFQLK